MKILIFYHIEDEKDDNGDTREIIDAAIETAFEAAGFKETGRGYNFIAGNRDFTFVKGE